MFKAVPAAPPSATTHVLTTRATTTPATGSHVRTFSGKKSGYRGGIRLEKVSWGYVLLIN